MSLLGPLHHLHVRHTNQTLSLLGGGGRNRFSSCGDQSFDPGKKEEGSFGLLEARGICSSGWEPMGGSWMRHVHSILLSPSSQLPTGQEPPWRPSNAGGSRGVLVKLDRVGDQGLGLPSWRSRRSWSRHLASGGLCTFLFCFELD